MKLKQTILIIFVFIILIGCNTENTARETERIFAEMYPDCEMNTILKLNYIGKLFEDARSIDIELTPTSKTSVIFPTGFNLRLLSFDTYVNEWVEIKNNIHYLPENTKYIVGLNDPIEEHTQLLIGVIPSLGKILPLRVVVHGNIYQNNIETDKCVGAFLDFEYVP